MVTLVRGRLSGRLELCPLPALCGKAAGDVVCGLCFRQSRLQGQDLAKAPSDKAQAGSLAGGLRGWEVASLAPGRCTRGAHAPLFRLAISLFVSQEAAMAGSSFQRSRARAHYQASHTPVGTVLSCVLYCGRLCHERNTAFVRGDSNRALRPELSKVVS